jgi:hypothetical protein
MQYRYAGDLGDFLKFGLLRWLAPPDSPWPRLGVIWYRTADEVHNADGKHVAYLTPATGQPGGCANSTRTCMTDSPASSAPGSAAPPHSLSGCPGRKGQVRCRCMRASGLLPIPPSPATLLAG